MGVGSGGFYLPRIYSEGKGEVTEALKKGEIDYAGMTKWQFPDEFLCFALQSGFFEFVDKTYPTPRKKSEVPVWFLISCQLILKLFNSARYGQLKYFLNAGSILTRVGFNLSNPTPGFNNKNKHDRETAVDPDTVRKFFKDTAPQEIRNWHNESLQGWFRGKRAFDSDGLFVLDQTHLVVPNNPNYKDAVRMPVDEHGQWYKNYDQLSAEQKKGLPYHPCYSLSLLLHIAKSEEFFHVAGYEFGPGNEDELVHARRLVPDFCKRHPGFMKEIIEDRGYIDGEFIGRMKKDYGVDTLVPLKRKMSTYEDAIDIARRKNQWEVICEEKDGTKLLKKTLCSLVEEMDLWENCPVKQHATVSKEIKWNEKDQKYDEKIWVLGATKKYRNPRQVVDRYALRTRIEERNRQLKCGWQIGSFTSPAPGLIESHICFTLLTYSLLQMYLRREDLRNQTNRMIQTLRMQDRASRDAVIVYAQDSFGVIQLQEYSDILLNADDSAKQKLKAMKATQEGALIRDPQS